MQRVAFTGGSEPLALALTVRSERDPYLYFLDISSGTKNFGLTAGEKVRRWRIWRAF